MKFFSLAVVVILGFASYDPVGAQIFTIGFPTRDPAKHSHKCVKRSLGTHLVSFSDIQTTDQRYFHRHLVSSLDWIQSSDSMIFLSPDNAASNPYNINNQVDCAQVVSANGYNSFTYDANNCVGYTYQASKCAVGPSFPFNGTGTPFVIFVANNQNSNSSKPYVPNTLDFGWLNSSDGTLRARFLIDGLYADKPITELIVRLSNGTEKVYTQSEITSPMTIEIPVEGDCTGQDLTIILKSNGEVVSEKTYPRNLCPGSDTCTGCVTRILSTRSAGEDKFSFRTLEDGCKKIDGHSVPIVNSELRRDQILSYIESNPDVSPDTFWVGFSRSAESSSFSWPDGSTDLSMFGNGKSFTPRSGEDCATAYVDVVSMELMIDSASCAQKRSGFCVL